MFCCLLDRNRSSVRMVESHRYDSLSLFLSLNTHNTQTTQIHVASQNKNIRKMLTTRLSPGGKSIRFLDRSWSRRLIQSETSKSIRVFSKSGWTVLFAGIQNRRRESDSRALALVTHFKMYLRRRSLTVHRLPPNMIQDRLFIPRVYPVFSVILTLRLLLPTGRTACPATGRRC